ncbi:MAG: hypothetical protein KKE20_01425, partial [Nanoarchaeota archaeon]|nr:hypothetical protein [Nanoarchaeota archaeon]
PATRFTKSPVPYRLVDGTIIANDWNDLISYSPYYLKNPLNLDENGIVRSGRVWTNTWYTGVRQNLLAPPNARYDSCREWSDTTNGNWGYSGTIGSMTAQWTGYGPTVCSGQNRLYCFRQDLP